MDKSVTMLAFLIVLLVGNVAHGSNSSGKILPCKVNNDCVNCTCLIHCPDPSTVCLNGQCKCTCGGYCLKTSSEIKFNIMK
ncbi:hypothetical protein Lalb_Chr01g0017151 [Lupinus albus]|uniref:Uncharacterized protein n=1 Tax=Lupinus albus TaxID=3870 RepID=A0A6A4R7N4_LUPAL|nr:hypothetical protein Lalb_Chr01g0017151 [Lupinus albus]